MSNERKFDGVWDARRLLQSYIVYADKDCFIPEVKPEEKYPYQIRLQQMVAAMRAYGRDEHSFYKSNDGWHRSCCQLLRSKNCSAEKIDVLRKLVKQLGVNKYRHEFIDSPKFFERTKELDILFSELFMYRKLLYQLETAWSGLMECPMSATLTIMAVKQYSDKRNKPLKDILDNILLLLMGDDYDKTFTEQELLAFGYPDVTAEELRDMEDDW